MTSPSHGRTDQYIHGLDHQLTAYPISKLYRNNNIWLSFGFNCFPVSSPLILISKHSHSHPFSLSLFFFRKIRKGCEVFFSIITTQVCAAFSAVFSQSYKALYWICVKIPLILYFWGRGETITSQWFLDQYPVPFKSGTSLCIVPPQLLHFPR